MFERLSKVPLILSPGNLSDLESVCVDFFYNDKSWFSIDNAKNILKVTVRDDDAPFGFESRVQECVIRPFFELPVPVGSNQMWAAIRAAILQSNSKSMTNGRLRSSAPQEILSSFHANISSEIQASGRALLTS